MNNKSLDVTATEIVLSTCRRIIALEDNFELNMSTYNSGSTYCIVGRLAQLDGHHEQLLHPNKFDHFGYACKVLLGRKFDVYSWLFSQDWPDSLEHAKARAQYLINNNAVPPNIRYFVSTISSSITLDLLNNLNAEMGTYEIL